MTTEDQAQATWIADHSDAEWKALWPIKQKWIRQTYGRSNSVNDDKTLPTNAATAAIIAVGQDTTTKEQPIIHGDETVVELQQPDKKLAVGSEAAVSSPSDNALLVVSPSGAFQTMTKTTTTTPATPVGAATKVSVPVSSSKQQSRINTAGKRKRAPLDDPLLDEMAKGSSPAPLLLTPQPKRLRYLDTSSIQKKKKATQQDSSPTHKMALLRNDLRRSQATNRQLVQRTERDACLLDLQRRELSLLEMEVRQLRAQVDQHDALQQEERALQQLRETNAQLDRAMAQLHTASLRAMYRDLVVKTKNSDDDDKTIGDETLEEMMDAMESKHQFAWPETGRLAYGGCMTPPPESFFSPQAKRRLSAAHPDTPFELPHKAVRPRLLNIPGYGELSEEEDEDDDVASSSSVSV